MNDYSPKPTPSTWWLSAVLGAAIGGVIGLPLGGFTAIPLAIVGFIVGLALAWRKPKKKGRGASSR